MRKIIILILGILFLAGGMGFLPGCASTKKETIPETTPETKPETTTSKPVCEGEEETEETVATYVMVGKVFSVKGRNVTVLKIGSSAHLARMGSILYLKRGENYTPIRVQTVMHTKIIYTGSGRVGEEVYLQTGTAKKPAKKKDCSTGRFKTYTIYRNGTVRDARTNLVWQRCSKGQNAINCSGDAYGVPWEDAKQYCRRLKLAGRSWRLPSKDELASILEEVKNEEGIYINPEAFPHTDWWYWTSTEESPVNAWSVFFRNGNVSSSYKTHNYYVRCVSSGP